MTSRRLRNSIHRPQAR